MQCRTLASLRSYARQLQHMLIYGSSYTPHSVPCTLLPVLPLVSYRRAGHQRPSDDTQDDGRTGSHVLCTLCPAPHLIGILLLSVPSCRWYLILLLQSWASTSLRSSARRWRRSTRCASTLICMRMATCRALCSSACCLEPLSCWWVMGCDVVRCGVSWCLFKKCLLSDFVLHGGHVW